MSVFEIAGRSSAVAFVFVLAGLSSSLTAQEALGANLTVSDLPEVVSYGSEAGVAAFSIGTVACNVGTVPIRWEPFTNQHPVIAQNAYLMIDGRILPIAESWLKHGVSALNGISCGACQPTSSVTLGIGCSDPYSAAFNGVQVALGPRGDVNPATGVFPFPPTQSPSGGLAAGRLAIAHSDLSAGGRPDATYLVEARYVVPDELGSDARHDNASTRDVLFAPDGVGSYAAQLVGPTHVGRSALDVWRERTPGAVVETVDVPGDGRLRLGFRWTESEQGTFVIDIVLANENSARAVAGLEVALRAGALAANVSHRKAIADDDEGPWTVQVEPGWVRWSMDADPNAPVPRPLLWGSLASLRFETPEVPERLRVELFTPGLPSVLEIAPPMPAFVLRPVAPEPGPVLDPERAQRFVFQPTLLLGDIAADAGRFVFVLEGVEYDVPLRLRDDGRLEATLPELPNSSVVSYRAEARALDGSLVRWPLPSPEPDPFRIVGLLAREFTFDGDAGFLVENDVGLTDGGFERGTPSGGGLRGDPIAAYGGVGAAYLTGNRPGNSDVDGGATRLISPSCDLSAFTSATLGYALWNDNDAGGAPGTDALLVEVSDDDGATWVLADSMVESPGTWVQRFVRLESFVTLSAQVRVRFVASDLGVPSIVECGVDEVTLTGIGPGPQIGHAGRASLDREGADVLVLNGQVGGPRRHVDVAANAPLSLTLSLPPNLATAPSLIFAHAARPGAPFTLPGDLELVLPPAPLVPDDRLAFLLADGTGWIDPSLLVPSGSVSLVFPSGLPAGLELTVQGIVIDADSARGFQRTNGISIRTL